MEIEGVVRATSYSTSIAAAAAGTPQRGSVHSVFAAAANILFPSQQTGYPRGALPHPPDARPLLYATGPPQGSPLSSEFVLSLNALDGPRMPNGLRLSVPEGAFPLAALRPGMSVLFGAQRLHIEAIECSIDLSACPQWDPHIHHPVKLDRQILEKNRERLAAIRNNAKSLSSMPDLAAGYPRGALHRPPDKRPLLYATVSSIEANVWMDGIETVYSRGTRKGYPAAGRGTQPGGQEHLHSIHVLARHLCGRGVGLTPTGDDILAGWMAVGWLLYGEASDFLEACQQIVEVAQRQTHLLSRCWLGYAARGEVAQPIVALVEALAGDGENEAQLAQAGQAVLAMGATSGYDVITGILLGLNMYLTSHC